MNKWLMNNNVVKIVALVLGVLLFVIVHKDDLATTTSPPSLIESRWIDNVQVRVIGLDTKQHAIKSMKPYRVRIQIRGKRTAITSTLPENYKAILDLTGYDKGKQIVQLNHQLLPGIDFISMQPSRVVVELEDVQTKEFEVQIRTKGTPANGYNIGTPIVKPAGRVDVTLPASRMAKVKSVMGIVNIDKVNEAVIKKQVKLNAYNAEDNKAIEKAILTPSSVEVEIPIIKPFKVVPLQVNLRGQLAEGLAVSSFIPDVNQVTLYGPHEALNSIEHFNVGIELHQLYTAGMHKLKVPLTPPANIEKIEPSEIMFNLQISGLKQRTLINVPISLTGGSDHFAATITEPTTRKIDVIVTGAPDLIDKLKTDDIQLIANVNDLSPGEHTVNLQVHLPRFVQRVSQTPLTVKVDIKDKEAPVTTSPGSKPPSLDSKGEEAQHRDP